jgi:hypothetical protein
MASGDTLAAWSAESGFAHALTTLFATFSTRNGHPILRFNDTTQWTAVFQALMPQNYAAGNIVVRVRSSATSAITGTIGWDATFERIDAGTLDVDADSFATAQTITAATVPGTAGVTSETTVTCTAGSTGTDSIAAGDLFRLRIRRDVANDTATGDAELHSVEIREA